MLPSLQVLSLIRSLCLLLVTWFLLACGGEPFHSIRNLHSSGDTIICFGDSLTEGVGADSGEEYPNAVIA